MTASRTTMAGLGFAVSFLVFGLGVAVWDVNGTMRELREQASAYADSAATWKRETVLLRRTLESTRAATDRYATRVDSLTRTPPRVVMLTRRVVAHDTVRDTVYAPSTAADSTTGTTGTMVAFVPLADFDACRMAADSLRRATMTERQACEATVTAATKAADYFEAAYRARVKADRRRWFVSLGREAFKAATFATLGAVAAGVIHR